jgi:hypothetical protein
VIVEMKEDFLTYEETVKQSVARLQQEVDSGSKSPFIVLLAPTGSSSAEFFSCASPGDVLGLSLSFIADAITRIAPTKELRDEGFELAVMQLLMLRDGIAQSNDFADSDDDNGTRIIFDGGEQ